MTPLPIEDAARAALGLGQAPSIALNGTLMTGGGSGATTPAVFVAPSDALAARAAQDDTALYHDFGNPQPAVISTTDTCIVLGNAWAAEGQDRPSLSDHATDALIRTVADQCNKTVVVLHNAGPRLVDGFADHANVTAILFAHLPGRDSGTSLVKLLYGEANPSGKLSYTVARQESDYGRVLGADEAEGRFQKFPQSDFSEGVLLDYRYFDKHGMTPRYEFGFGLSYTTFALSNMSVRRISGGNAGEWPLGTVMPGGRADLFDNVALVSVDVRNTGGTAGAEVPQLYVGIPGAAAARQLRGYEKRFLQAGESTTVEFALTRRDLSVWDSVAQEWRLQRGRYTMHVGTSSRKLALTDSLTI